MSVTENFMIAKKDDPDVIDINSNPITYSTLHSSEKTLLSIQPKIYQFNLNVGDEIQ